MDLVIEIDAKYRKWMTLVGGFTIYLTMGYIYTFGTMNPYITSYLRNVVELKDVRYSNSIWISSITVGSQAFSSIIAGLFQLRGINPRILMLVGSLLMCTSVLLTYFTVNQSLVLMTLTWGVGHGFGFGLIYVQPLVFAMKWFVKSKGKATSLILVGNGVGALIFNQIITFFINPKNYVPDEVYSPDFPNEKYFSVKYESLLKRVPYNFLLNGGILLVMQIIGILLISEPNKTNTKKVAPNDDIDISTINGKVYVEELKNVDQSDQSDYTGKEVNSLGVETQQGAIESGLGITKVLRLPQFYILWMAFYSAFLVTVLMTTYYKTFGVTFIKDDQFLSLVGSLSMLFNGFGRIVWGVIIDKFSFKTSMLVINTMMFFFLMTLYATKIANSEAMFMIWICVLYFGFCGVSVFFPTIIVKTFGQKNFTIIFGVLYTNGIVASLTAAFMGSLIDSIGWFGMFATISGFCLTSWLMTLLFNVTKSNGEYI